MEKMKKILFLGFLYTLNIMHAITVNEMVNDPDFRKARPEVVAEYFKAKQAYEISYKKRRNASAELYYGMDFEPKFERNLLNDCIYAVVSLRYLPIGTPDETASVDILSGEKTLNEKIEQILRENDEIAYNEHYYNNQKYSDFNKASIAVTKAYFAFRK